MRPSAAARMRRDETQGVPGVRTPPHSIEAEQAVLGRLLLESFAFDNVVDIVRNEDSYRPADHRLIFTFLGQFSRFANYSPDAYAEGLRRRNIPTLSKS